MKKYFPETSISKIIDFINLILEEMAKLSMIIYEFQLSYLSKYERLNQIKLLISKTNAKWNAVKGYLKF